MSDARSAPRESFARSEVVLLAMAAGGPGTLFEPVRIQKLLFLIDREIPHPVGGPHFDFRPCRYGPFDHAVYDELDALSRAGQVRIAERPGRRTYVLTAMGLDRGRAALKRLPEEVRGYPTELARWVLSLGFGRLLAAVCRRYPEMAENTVAPDVAHRSPPSASRLPMPPFLEGMASAFDLTGTFLTPTSQETGFRGDAEALEADWRAVGDDLRAAMAEYATTNAGGV